MKTDWKVGDRFRCECSEKCKRDGERVVTGISGNYLEVGKLAFHESLVMPVIQAHDVEEKAHDPFVGDPRFHAALKEMATLHDERQKGYGTATDSFANVRASEGWGISPWMGAMIRGCDKIRRLQTFAQTGKLAGEKVEDAFLDLANYAVIALVLYREEKEKSK